jgi:hypothetical protein
LTYIISYLYLAWYHDKILLFNTIVHESGTYTLLENIFYASNFLGHIPVHTMLAFLFVGFYLCLTGDESGAFPKKKIRIIFYLLIIFLIGSFFLSLSVFGYEDTSAFIFQQKQSMQNYTKGGSWNLHIPSTIMLLALIPVYIYCSKKIFGKSIALSSRWVRHIFLGFIMPALLFTYFLNRTVVDVVFSVWKDPRYLAHSVRELMTFPVTYFPLPLFFFLRRDRNKQISDESTKNRNLEYIIVLAAALFLVGLFYQSYIPLAEGIGNLAQKPEFAKGGKLGISYLLASHYFEHFLDTIYFTLLSMLLYGLAINKK